MSDESRKWWTMTLRMYRPEETEKLRKQMEEDRRRLFSCLEGRPDGDNLVATLQRLINNSYAFAHYYGIRRGFVLASLVRKFESEKKDVKAKVKIASLMRQHPDWSMRQIFQALDEMEIPLYRLGKLPKSTTRWSDVVSEQIYKTIVSRIRKKVNAKVRAEAFKKMMRQHKSLRKARE